MVMTGVRSCFHCRSDTILNRGESQNYPIQGYCFNNRSSLTAARNTRASWP